MGAAHRVLQWAVVGILLAVALWRGDVLVRAGSKPQETQPGPGATPSAPPPVSIVVTVEALDGGTARVLAGMLGLSGGAVRDACAVPESDPVSSLVDAVLSSAAGPDSGMLCFLSEHPSVGRFRRIEGLGGVHVLSRAEAPELAAGAVAALARAGGPAVVWLHFRDLAEPPPRPRRELRRLRALGFRPPGRDALERWLADPALAPPEARAAFEALRTRRLERITEALRLLVSSRTPSALRECVVLGDPGSEHGREKAGPVPGLVLVPRDGPCPGFLEILGAADVRSGTPERPSPTG